MTSIAVPMPFEGRGRKRPHRLLAMALAVAAFSLLSLSASTFLHLRIPAGTGEFAVGKLRTTLIDESRMEPHTSRLNDHRAVPLQVWYPAVAGTGEPAAYVDDLAALRSPLVESEELTRLEVWGLQWIRDSARLQAAPTESNRPHPVLLLSPGNDTNVVFYSTLAQSLASAGYVVIGLDHPFQVAAVLLPNGEVARNLATAGSAVIPDEASRIRSDIDQRVADIGFVIDRLAVTIPELGFPAGSVDTSAIGILGHSNGGLAAVEACRRDRRLLACVNVDGQNMGGPFGVDVGDLAPEQPFMFLTKETELHPELGRRFEEAGEGGLRVVLPGASHGDFTDGALFSPTLSPLPGHAQAVLSTAGTFLRAFFDDALGVSAAERPFDGLDADVDIYVNVYPLGDRSPVPTTDPAGA